MCKRRWQVMASEGVSGVRGEVPETRQAFAERSRHRLSANQRTRPTHPQTHTKQVQRSCGKSASGGHQKRSGALSDGEKQVGTSRVTSEQSKMPRAGTKGLDLSSKHIKHLLQGVMWAVTSQSSLERMAWLRFSSLPLRSQGGGKDWVGGALGFGSEVLNLPNSGTLDLWLRAKGHRLSAYKEPAPGLNGTTTLGLLFEATSYPLPPWSRGQVCYKI